jgi:hypothetical protein
MYKTNIYTGATIYYPWTEWEAIAAGGRFIELNGKFYGTICRAGSNKARVWFWDPAVPGTNPTFYSPTTNIHQYPYGITTDGTSLFVAFTAGQEVGCFTATDPPAVNEAFGTSGFYAMPRISPGIVFDSASNSLWVGSADTTDSFTKVNLAGTSKTEYLLPTTGNSYVNMQVEDGFVYTCGEQATPTVSWDMVAMNTRTSKFTVFTWPAHRNQSGAVDNYTCDSIIPSGNFVYLAGYDNTAPPGSGNFFVYKVRKMFQHH